MHSKLHHATALLGILACCHSPGCFAQGDASGSQGKSTRNATGSATGTATGPATGPSTGPATGPSTGTATGGKEGAADEPRASAWPDYRGPTRDGHAPSDAKPPLRWSDKENVRWKTELRGTGWSSPVVHDKKVWMTSATKDGKEHFVLAVDFETGELVHDKTLWKIARPQPKHRMNSYASPSPVVDAERVYVHFGTYGTACLDAVDAKLLWERRDLECDHIVGPGSSLCLYEDLLIFHVDGGDVQYVIALDKKSGETRWKTQRSVDFRNLTPDERKAYSTPILARIDGEERLICVGAEATNAYEPKTGKELWRYRYKGFSMSFRPVVYDGMLYLSTGFMKAQLHAVHANGRGDVTEENLAWSYRRNVPTIPSPLVVDGRFYMLSDSGIASCLDAKTGKALWRQRLDGAYCASPVFANGRIYLFDREGRTHVLAPGDEYRVLAENQLGDGFMASPAIVGDAFVLRSKTHLYRVEAR